MAKASGVNISFEGLKELKEKFKNLSEDAAKDVDAIISGTCDEIVELARRNLAGGELNPNDFQKPLEKLFAVTDNINNLKGRIGVNPRQFLNYTIVADSPYAAYVEFGTGGAVKIPAGLEDYAIQFKKPNRQNISMPARPYLFPAFFEKQKEIVPLIIEVLTT